MNEDIPIEKPIPKTELDEVNEFVEELQQENKEIYEIMQSPLYKTLYQVLSRVTLKMEIVNIDRIASSPGTTPTQKTDTKKEGKTESIKFQNVILVEQTEKGNKFRNESFETCWFSKKGIKYNESTKELEVLGWWIDFVNKNGDKIEFKKES